MGRQQIKIFKIRPPDKWRKVSFEKLFSIKTLFGSDTVIKPCRSLWVYITQQRFFTTTSATIRQVDRCCSLPYTSLA